MNPFSILSQILPLAKDDEHAAELAAKMGPPPTNFQPHTGNMGRVGMMQMQGHPLVGGGPMMIPPMPMGKTQGEARTNPGSYLLNKRGAL